MTRNVCVVTTSRADYGHLFWLMKAIDDDPGLSLGVIATGMHLSTEHGLTVEAIERDGFRIDRRLEMLLSADSESAIAKSMGVALISLGEGFREIRPDILVLLGDRFEIVPFALAAVLFGIPLAHIHGGETSQGAIDEIFRHAVTKMANLHFPATENYRKRILQLGEDPQRVFNFGAPGLDAMYRAPLIDRHELGKELQFSLNGPVAIITYHPATADRGAALVQINEVLEAVRASGVRAVFTKANADREGSVINGRLAEFCDAEPERYRLFDSLGQRRYLSCLRNLELMIGNSSSGLIEAPSFGMPVVNVGDRQKGRDRAENVIDVGNAHKEIAGGISRALSPAFRESLQGLVNPYDRFRDGRASERIRDALKSVELSAALLRKEFHDHAG